MRVQVITPPAAYPVTLAEAKEWCRIRSTDNTQNATLNLLIAAMTEHAEHLTGRAFVERELEVSLPCFGYRVMLPQQPVLDVVSVSYYDSDAALQVYPSTSYTVEHGAVRPVLNATWPAVGGGGYDYPVRIRYHAGYRPSASPADLTDNSYLPPQLRIWIAARICTLYENRGQLIVGTIVAALPRDFTDAALDPLVLGNRMF